MFDTIVGTFEISFKYPFKRGHFWPLYRPQERLKLRLHDLHQRFVVNYGILDSQIAINTSQNFLKFVSLKMQILSAF